MTKPRENYVDKQRRHADRRAAIVRHYGQAQNFQTTADEFGISRERVRQIVEMEKAREPETMGDSK